MDDETYFFDSFECAIGVLAPTCKQCDNRIIGHGIEANGAMYCCAHCAHRDGVSEATDRV